MTATIRDNTYVGSKRQTLPLLVPTNSIDASDAIHTLSGHSFAPSTTYTAMAIYTYNQRVYACVKMCMYLLVARVKFESLVSISSSSMICSVFHLFLGWHIPMFVWAHFCPL